MKTAVKAKLLIERVSNSQGRFSWDRLKRDANCYGGFSHLPKLSPSLYNPCTYIEGLVSKECERYYFVATVIRVVTKFTEEMSTLREYMLVL